MEEILRVLQNQPEGIKLIDLGNALGVNWRSLIGPVGRLLEQRKIGKMDSIYYPISSHGLRRG